MKTDLAQSVVKALTELQHSSMHALFDYSNEVEEVTWNSVLLPQQHSSLKGTQRDKRRETR